MAEGDWHVPEGHETLLTLQPRKRGNHEIQAQHEVRTVGRTKHPRKGRGVWSRAVQGSSSSSRGITPGTGPYRTAETKPIPAKWEITGKDGKSHLRNTAARRPPESLAHPKQNKAGQLQGSLFRERSKFTSGTIQL
eukprot:363683-Chlamydomonas_euryale.AAC.1